MDVHEPFPKWKTATNYKTAKVLQLNFYHQIFVIVLLQSFVTMLENLYCEQYYEQS
jgi:hypothetical protein